MTTTTNPQEWAEAYEQWRSDLLLNGPDTSIAAYIHHLEAEEAVAKLKEIE
jgi:hypothetical protein